MEIGAIAYDFVTKLLVTRGYYNAIWVIIDNQMKSDQFIPMRMNYSLAKLAILYISEIVQYHDILKVIVSNRDQRFASNFWKVLQVTMGTQLTYSTIHTLKNFLRPYLLHSGGNYEHLPLVVFTYNNSYQCE